MELFGCNVCQKNSLESVVVVSTCLSGGGRCPLLHFTATRSRTHCRHRLTGVYISRRRNPWNHFGHLGLCSTRTKYGFATSLTSASIHPQVHPQESSSFSRWAVFSQAFFAATPQRQKALLTLLVSEDCSTVCNLALRTHLFVKNFAFLLCFLSRQAYV